MSNPQTLRFFRSRLPHWLVADRAYFVTIRVKGTLPVHVLEKFKQLQLDSDASETEKQRNMFVNIDRFLDSSDAENRLLDNPKIAEMLLESLRWLESKGWVVYAAVVLSTHMHMLMRNEDGQTGQLLKQIAAYKNYTATIANKILGRKGSFWARDCFDHWIRTPDKFESTVRYIANNPAKAGRVKSWHEWPWVRVHDDVLYCIAE